MFDRGQQRLSLPFTILSVPTRSHLASLFCQDLRIRGKPSHKCYLEWTGGQTCLLDSTRARFGQEYCSVPAGL